MKTLSIQQPWAWLIANGHKDVENRTWATAFLGEFLIHSGKKFDDASTAAIERMAGKPISWDARAMKTGGFVGIAEIYGCVKQSASPWFVGTHGFLIRNARPIPFVPYRGQLQFFDVPYELQDGQLVEVQI